MAGWCRSWTRPMDRARYEEYLAAFNGRDYARLGAFWEAHGVPHLDLLDVFGGRSSQELTVNARDAHPNEQGHALAADAVLAFLSEQLSE